MNVTISTAEIKAPVPEDDKFRVVEELVAEFSADHDVVAEDGARVAYDGGWALVRASNTTANLTLRFEARDIDWQADPFQPQPSPLRLRNPLPPRPQAAE